MVGETVTALLAPWPLKFVFDRVLLVHHHQLRVIGSVQWRLLPTIFLAPLGDPRAPVIFPPVHGHLAAGVAPHAPLHLRPPAFLPPPPLPTPSPQLPTPP